MKVVYSDRMNANSGSRQSPSAHKPALMKAYLEKHSIFGLPLQFVPPPGLQLRDFYRCHNPSYVDGVLDLEIRNGFGTFSESVCRSLPFTTGSLYEACRLATPEMPACSLSAGFHHAGYEGCMPNSWFCTFNGLMIAAMKLVKEDGFRKISIIDCDMHWGNGTDDILLRLASEGFPRRNHTFGTITGPYHHVTFGWHFRNPSHARMYLSNFYCLRADLAEIKPDLIIYQSGADVHVDDPYGGIFTAKQMALRDLKMFRIAKDLGIPLAWNLAGGYQKEKDGSIDKVLKLHHNTFRACANIYANWPSRIVLSTREQMKNIFSH